MLAVQVDARMFYGTGHVKLSNCTPRWRRSVKSLGAVEFVTRDRYVLLRTNRIFADLVIMSGALRLAVHLPREAEHPLFIKIGADRKQVTHVAKLHDLDEVESMKPFLREAYEYSIS